MVVTEAILEQGLSARGGYTCKQLRALLPEDEFTGPGTWSMRKGWKRRIIGQIVDDWRVEDFLKHRKKIKIDKTGNLFERRDAMNKMAAEGMKRMGFKRATDNWTDFDAIMSIDDQNHLDSITQELVA